MLKEKAFFSQLNLAGCFFLLLLPFMLLACGDEGATQVANQPTAATKTTPTVSASSPVQTTSTQPQVSVQATSKTITQVAVTSKVITTPASNTGSSKVPRSGEDACTLVSKEEVSEALGITLDKVLPESKTGFSCNYYTGDNLVLQVFFEKFKGTKSLIDSQKFIYPDAKLIEGVGDYNWWSAESGRYEILQGTSNFNIVMLSGETDKAKLLEQATKVAQLVISQIK